MTFEEFWQLRCKVVDAGIEIPLFCYVAEEIEFLLKELKNLS